MSDAKSWVGDSQPQDTLDLEKIKKALPPQAAVLRKILEDSRVAGLLTIRREASAAAARAQRSFKAASIFAVLGTAIATLASGLLLYGAGSEPAVTAESAPVQQTLVQWVTDHRTITIGVQVIGLFMTAVSSALLGARDFVARWAEKRRQAETHRREVFDEVLKLAANEMPAAMTVSDPSNPVRQALEFFRRYQLDLQIAFYGKSGARHGSWAGALAWITAILAGIAAISGVIGGLGATAAVLSAFLGIAVPILLSAAQSWRAATRDTDKAAAYEKAQEALQQIELDLSDIRGKADRADAAAVQAYIDRVHLVMASENEAWVPAAPGAATS